MNGRLRKCFGVSKCNDLVERCLKNGMGRNVHCCSGINHNPNANIDTRPVTSQLNPQPYVTSCIQHNECTMTYIQ